MIRVFVWPFRGSDDAWDHASLEVDGGTPGGSVYISWWPQNPGERVKEVGGRAIHGDLYCSGAIPNRKFADDVRAEAMPPSHIISLPGSNERERGMDETGVKDWWLALIKQGRTDWCSLGPNCSTITAYALHAGGGESFSSMWNSSNVVWTPSSVAAYAYDIREGIAYAHANPTPPASDAGVPLPGGVAG